MKKYLFTFLTIMLALFMVACDPSTPPQNEDQPETPEEPVTPPEEVTLNAPSWAIGNFYGSISLGDETTEDIEISLAITDDSFTFNMPDTSISSDNSTLVASNGVEAETTGTWNVELTVENISYTIKISKTDIVGNIEIIVNDTLVPTTDLYTVTPEWAYGDYTGSLALNNLPIATDVILNIGSESFLFEAEINMGVQTIPLNINYPNGIVSLKSSFTDSIWNTTVNGVTLEDGTSLPEIPLTIEKQAEGGLSLSLSFGSLPISGTFTPVPKVDN